MCSRVAHHTVKMRDISTRSQAPRAHFSCAVAIMKTMWMSGDVQALSSCAPAVVRVIVRLEQTFPHSLLLLERFPMTCIDRESERG
mmetsp:Transcript_3266/g.6347  ORF Transcript_3266/g.6347 Transcript_3266/m.6347 type:complete len:86 (-) Transcript_3266:8-265(-)